jgi:acyl transferase domain-containing protein
MRHALGFLWVNGVEIDWAGYKGEESRRRVELPTYPWERQRYWVEAHKPSREIHHPGAVEPVKNPHVADWFYTPAWTSSVSPSSLDDPGLEERRRWLIWADDDEAGRALGAQLEVIGQEVIMVLPGENFHRESDGLYRVRPTTEAFDRLLGEVQSEGTLPHKIVHLVGTHHGPPAGGEASGMGEVDRTGFYALFHLAQALARRRIVSSLELEILTLQAHQVTGSDRVNPAAAMVLGLGKVISQEFPFIVCRAIDREGPDGARAEGETPGWVQEMISSRRDPVVAYRQGRRWVQTFRRVPLREGRRRPSLLRSGGVYLITGGLGKVGLALAARLARDWKAKLALLGRSGKPRGAGGRDPIKALEQAGAEVMVVSADAADETSLRQAMDQVEQRFGSIHGVIHAAGMTGPEGFGPVEKLDRAECEAQFQPKVQGLQVLENVLRDRAPDFCLLTSSLSTVLGGWGFGPYAAANAFMDAFASARPVGEGTRWISAGWDGWQFAADPGARPQTEAARYALTPEEGGAVLEWLLSVRHVPWMVVSTGDLAGRLARAFPETPDPSAGDWAGDIPVDKHARPALFAAYQPPENDLETAVARLWADMLGLEKVGIDDNFFELGGTSLIGTQVMSRLRASHAASLSLASLFEGPTVRSLSRLIRDHQTPPAENPQTEIAGRGLLRKQAMARRARNKRPAE